MTDNPSPSDIRQEDVRDALTPIAMAMADAGYKWEVEIEYVEELLAAYDAALSAEPTWRHKKRGSTYTEIGRAKLQSNDPTGLGDMQPMVVYRSHSDGSLWVRPEDEFEDGRFERIASPPPQPDTALDHLQQRGRHYDIIQQAIADYDEWMLDDDYDAMTKLHGIMGQMRARLALSDPPDTAPSPLSTGEETTTLPAETVAQWFLDNHQQIDLSILPDLTDLVRRARNDGPATEQIRREVKALEQIAVVCTDNMDRSCNHRMALDFVRQVANAALAATEQARSQEGKPTDHSAEQGGHWSDHPLQGAPTASRSEDG